MFTLLRTLFIQPSSAQDVLIGMMSDEIPVPAKEHIGKNCRFLSHPLRYYASRSTASLKP
jgi:hypothetical protein